MTGRPDIPGALYRSEEDNNDDRPGLTSPSIAIAGAWGYIGRRFLDVALDQA